MASAAPPAAPRTPSTPPGRRWPPSSGSSASTASLGSSQARNGIYRSALRRTLPAMQHAQYPGCFSRDNYGFAVHWCCHLIPFTVIFLLIQATVALCKCSLLVSSTFTSMIYVCSHADGSAMNQWSDFRSNNTNSTPLHASSGGGAQGKTYGLGMRILKVFYSSFCRIRDSSSCAGRRDNQDGRELQLPRVHPLHDGAQPQELRKVLQGHHQVGLAFLRYIIGTLSTTVL